MLPYNPASSLAKYMPPMSGERFFSDESTSKYDETLAQKDNSASKQILISCNDYLI
jgi:hypothetical protein